MTLIADSGSTKTAWCLLEDPQKVIYTQGINPFVQDEEAICAVLHHELLPALPIQQTLTHIYFYGAGCTLEKAPLVAQAIRQVTDTSAHIYVESDMLGAARGVCGQQSGIVGILGTGSNSCYYDGTCIHTAMPALGYVLGDEGSGAYIGKRLVSDVLKHQLPNDVCQLFFDETHETQASIIQKVYRMPLPNRYLASLSPFCARHRHHPAIHSFIIDCFEQYFRRNILPANWTDNLSENPKVNFVGSIAYYYQDELRQTSLQLGYTVGNIIQSPLKGLIQYHKK